MALPDTLQYDRVLYLTKNPDWIRRQLDGFDLTMVPSAGELRSEVTTDQIIPAKFTTSSVGVEKLGGHLLRGVGGIDAIIQEGEIEKAGFKYIVAQDIGGGSSREHAQHALVRAGIRGVFASSWGEIFGRNNINYGIPTLKLESKEVQRFLQSRQPIPIGAYLNSLGPLSRLVAECGGILEFTRKRLANELKIIQPETVNHPMNSLEKVYASILNLSSVEQGQQYLVPWDWAYFYELQSKDMGDALSFMENLGAKIKRPDRIIAFEDHLAGRFDVISDSIREVQRKIVNRFKIRDFRADQISGVSAICHSKMAEEMVEPGQFVIGNDSHTNALEFMGSLVSAVGATEMAVALFCGDTLVTIPEVIKINLLGKLRKGVHAKDLTLHIGALSEFRKDKIGLGRKLYYEGHVLDELPADEQFVLANMSRENQAEGGFILPNRQTLLWLQMMRPDTRFNLDDWDKFKPDSDAQYSHIINLNLAEVEPTIALPGDPQNGVSLSSLKDQPEVRELIGHDGKVHISKVYTGSCMGGTLEVLKNMAEVLLNSNGTVRKVHPDIKFYFQAASDKVFQMASRAGYIRTLEEAGAILVKTACGACIGVGDGAVDNDNEVAVFDTNRNFDGREGAGKGTKIFLANEEISAASAVAGYICLPDEIY